MVLCNVPHHTAHAYKWSTAQTWTGHWDELLGYVALLLNQSPSNTKLKLTNSDLVIPSSSVGTSADASNRFHIIHHFPDWQWIRILSFFNFPNLWLSIVLKSDSNIATKWFHYRQYFLMDHDFMHQIFFSSTILIINVIILCYLSVVFVLFGDIQYMHILWWYDWIALPCYFLHKKHNHFVNTYFLTL